MLSQTITDPFGTGKLPVGLILDSRYMVMRKIAQGGMGAVYEAKEVPTSPTSRRLAIKEMSFSMLNRLQEDQRKAVVESFHREYDLLSQLNHPNLVRAFEFFEESGRQYFVMEYIEGKTLESLLEFLPPGEFFPIGQVLAWARQLCDALRYLHSQTPPIIYRDLKPSNIMEVAGSNLLKLFDFGIARYYKPGQRSDTVRFGTDGYLAPEIIAYQTQTSKQTDVFALGAVLHQLLTRYDPQIDPWRRPSIRAINSLVPENVWKAIEHALSLNPDTRTPSAEVVLKDLFGEQAEIEITSVSLQNPFKKDTNWVEQPVMAFEAPSNYNLSGQMQTPPSQVPDSKTRLDLGPVQQGQAATGQFQVVAPLSGYGQVSSAVPWLAAKPDKFSSSDSRITMIASTQHLPLSSWDASTEPAWFSKLPSPLRGWLGFHLSFLVPRPLTHQGMIFITFPDAPRTQIEVSVDVQPAGWTLVFGWLIAIGLMSMEVILVMGVFFSVLFLIL